MTFCTTRANEMEGKRRNVCCNGMSRVTCFNVLFLMLCTCGFVYQTSDLAKKYFSYTTATPIDIRLPTRLVTPDVSFCIRYRDLIGNNTSPDNMTISDIFQQTPRSSEIMQICIYRMLNTYDAVVVKDNSSECYRQFNVSKFYVAEFICYRFRKIMSDIISGSKIPMSRFRFENIANSLFYQGIFYGIFLDKSLVRTADLCKVILHPRNSWPAESIATSAYFSRYANDEEKYSLVRAGYSTIEINRMKAPYDSDCVTYGRDGRKGCENRCIRSATISIFGKVPFTTIETEPVDYGHINKRMIQNQNFSETLDAIEKKCIERCIHSECQSLLFSTTIVKEESGEFDAISILVHVPIAPRIKVTRIPKFELVDFIVFVTSLIGTYFGISALDLNPVRILNKRHKNQEQKKQDKIVAKDSECSSCDDCLHIMVRMFEEIRTLKYKMGFLKGNKYFGKKML